MEFNFDVKNTGVFQRLRWVSSPLLKHTKLLSWLFLYGFIISLFAVILSFSGFILISTAIKISIFSFCLFILFLELHLFVCLKIKKYKSKESLLEAIKSGAEYNLAEFLSLNACEIVKDTLKICQKSRAAQVNSTALFYASLKNNDCSILIYRLGINIKQLSENLKNYLENQERQPKFELVFSESFQVVIKEAANIAVQRQNETIGEKEILVALAKNDEFFKKVLVEYDLKETDIENITLWLSAVEEKIEKSKEFWTMENLSRFGSVGRDFAAGFTATLDAFSDDLTKLASKNIFGEITGHKKEIDELEVILVKSNQSNALIVGDAGVGKKSIVRALAQRCFLKTSLPELNSKRVVQLDMVSLTSQIQSLEKLESTLDKIFQEAFYAGNIILCIDQLDRFVGKKIQKPGEIDISGVLAKYLAMPQFKFIATTSFDGLHRNIEQNYSFLQYFVKVEVLEVSELETIKILQGFALQMEHRHKILVLYPTIREVVNLTARNLPSTSFPKKAIDVLDEAVSYVKSLREKVVLPSHIAKVISDKTQIPIGKMEFQEKSVLLNLENLISQRIIGQGEAVNEISIAMRRARSGLSSKKRPMGVLLFLGSTGVGKTETAKALAQIYFGGEEKMIRLDMSEFQSVSDIPKLVGQVSPVEEQGLLTTPVRENPFSLVLLDEIEKAHPNILNLFLQVFDEGNITDGQGRKVIFTNTIIICTSNAGADVIFEQIKSGQKIEKDKVFDFLFQKGIFKPELINRFDAAVFFSSLTKENLLRIAQLNLERLAKNLKEKDIDFNITEALKEKIVELSYKPEFGARQMRRVIQDKIENVIAAALLSDKVVKGDRIEINAEDFSVVKNGEIHPAT